MIFTRRRFVQTAAASGMAAALPGWALTAPGTPMTRTILSSGEAIPAIGLGTWITFNVGDDPVLRDECTCRFPFNSANATSTISVCCRRT